MRVLDIGLRRGVTFRCSWPSASGRPVSSWGVDIAQKPVDLARHRAEESGIENVVFHLAADPEIETEPFDFVIGRYVVHHQQNPVEFIRAAAARLRPGGIIAFHEIDVRTGFATLPAVAYFDAVAAEMVAQAQAVTATPDAAGRLVSPVRRRGPAGAENCSASGRPAAILIRRCFRWCAANFAAIRALTHPRRCADLGRCARGCAARCGHGGCMARFSAPISAAPGRVSSRTVSNACRFGARPITSGSPLSAGRAALPNVFDRIAEIGVVPVIAIENPEHAVPLADALLKGGLSIAEITFRTAAAAEVIARMAKERPALLVGAGTVLDRISLDIAIKSGAQFGLAPGFDAEIVDPRPPMRAFPSCPAS